MLINLGIPASLKVNWNTLFLFLLACLFTTVLRVSFLLVYPFLILAVMYLYQFRITKTLISILIVLLVSWIISFYNGFFWKYNLVSLYYFLPFLLLLFSRPSIRNIPSNTVEVFIMFLALFAVLNNLVGFVQYFRHPDDDSFAGIYGKFTVTQNGLSLLNGVLFFYFLQKYIRSKKLIHIIATCFFLFSMVLGFYGAGLVAILVSLGLFYARFSFTGVIRIIFALILIAGASYFIMKFISPRTLEYNVNIAEKFLNTSRDKAPRKIVVFYNYYDLYTSRPASLLFGSGPGTFNSRSAFMVGSPSYFYVDVIKSEKKPVFFQTGAYTLWNPSNINRFTGFIAQPFSSFLALLAEYGLLLTLLFFFGLLKQYKTTMNLAGDDEPAHGMVLFKRLYKFLVIFLVMLILIDNYIEYPEVIALLVLLIKFLEQKIRLLAQGRRNPAIA
jgi:hypothetical protein